MRRKHFYSHLVSSTDITLEIASLDVTNKERVHLLSLVEANIHTKVIATVLDQLNPEDKKIFLKNLAEENHQKIWEHLNLKLNNAQTKIEDSIKKIIKELTTDIKKARKLESK